MKNVFSSQKANFLIIFLSAFFVTILGMYVYTISASRYSRSVLDDKLEVMSYGAFGGGVTTGYDLSSAQVGLAVLNGKVGIGTSNPTSLLTVNGDLEVKGWSETGPLIVNDLLSVRGVFSTSLDCPLYSGSTLPVYGRISFSDKDLVRYSGMVPISGVYIDETSTNSDERLFWFSCNKGGNSYPTPVDVLGFSNVRIVDGHLEDSLFFPSQVFSPSGISYANVHPVIPIGPILLDILDKNYSYPIYNDTSSRYAFCEELGLTYSNHVVAYGNSTSCRKFNSSTNRWEPITSSSYIYSIDCARP
ncbi:MAG: hypothetical protein ACOX0C_03310 [Patescibacteria group bacterium]|jgi:hypothetical protein